MIQNNIVTKSTCIDLWKLEGYTPVNIDRDQILTKDSNKEIYVSDEERERHKEDLEDITFLTKRSDGVLRVSERVRI